MSRRIFLADDSVTIQKVIELTFSDGDYEVQSVSNGDEALAALPTADPDFIILDVHMPGANGYEVCRRAKQSNPGVPVLLLVGTFEPFDEAHARSCGADAILKKPFDSQELLEQVESLIAARSSSSPGTSPVAVPTQELPFASFEPAAAPAEPPPFAPAPTEPSWGSFDLEPAPAAPSFAPPAPTPFDREPSFVLEPDPAYEAPAEPVFALEDREPAIAFRAEEEVEPAEPAYQDRFLAEPDDFGAATAGTAAWNLEPAAPPAPEPLPHDEPELELDLPDEPLLPAWTETVAPAPIPFAPMPPASPAPVPEHAAPAEAEVAPSSFETPSHFAHEVDELEATAPAMSSPLAAAPPEAQPHSGNGRLSDEEVERIARRVVSLLGDKAVREIAWEVVPDLAEVIIRDRLRDLEGQVETL